MEVDPETSEPESSPLSAVLDELSRKLDCGEELEGFVAGFSGATVTRLLHEAVVAEAEENKKIIKTPPSPVVLEFLLKHGAAVNYRDPTDQYLRSILHHAVDGKLLSTTQLLLENKADVNALCIDPDIYLPPGPDDPDFWPAPVEASCLTIAVTDGNVEMTELLLKNGADLKYALQRGVARYCTEDGDLPMLKCLAENGADFSQVFEEPEWYAPYSLADVLFNNACSLEGTMRQSFADAIQHHASWMRDESDEYQRSLDCLRFVLSTGAPPISPERISSACTRGDFGTICQLYYHCVTHGCGFLLPDLFPEIEDTDRPLFIPSGPEILAEMLRNWSPRDLLVSDEFLTGLEAFVGVVQERTEVASLKKFCISQVRLCLLGKEKRNFFDRLELLRVPQGVKSMIAMKQLSDRVDKEALLAKQQVSVQYKMGGLVKHIDKCVAEYEEHASTWITELRVKLNSLINSTRKKRPDVDLLLPLCGDDERQHFARLRKDAEELRIAGFRRFLEPTDHLKNRLSGLVLHLTQLCDAAVEQYCILRNDVASLLTLYLNRQQDFLQRTVQLNVLYKELWDLEFEEMDTQEQLAFRATAAAGNCSSDLPDGGNVLKEGTGKKLQHDDFSA